MLQAVLSALPTDVREGRMEAVALQEYDAWLADHMEKLVADYPSKVVAIHAGQVVFTGDEEVEVYQWVHKAGLIPMPLVFRVPQDEDLQSIL